MKTSIDIPLSSTWNETQFTNKIRDVLAALGGYSIKLGASRFMAKGTPDTIFCLGGQMFFLESKVFPFKPSDAQLIQLERITGAGSPSWICTLKDMSIWMYDGENHYQFDTILDALKFAHDACSKSNLDPFI